MPRHSHADRTPFRAGYSGARFTVLNADSMKGLSLGVRGRANNWGIPWSSHSLRIGLAFIWRPRSLMSSGRWSSGRSRMFSSTRPPSSSNRDSSAVCCQATRHAVESEAGGQLVRDQRVVGGPLQGQEGPQEALDLQGPARVVVAPRRRAGRKPQAGGAKQAGGGTDARG